MQINNGYLYYTYLFLALFSVSINSLLSLPANISVTYIYLPIIFFLAVLDVANELNRKFIAIWAFALCLALISFIIHPNTSKYLLYLTFAFSIGQIMSGSYTRGIQVVIYFAACLACIIAIPFSTIHYLSGGNQIDLYDSMGLKKQEYTGIFVVYIGYFYYLYKTKSIELFDKALFVIVIGVCILTGNKSVIFVFCLLFTAFNMKTIITVKGLLYTLLAAFVMSLLGFFNYLPEIIYTYFEHYFGSGLLSPEEYRTLDTLFIRIHILNENLYLLIESTSNFLFGTGINAAAGGLYESEFTWYLQDIESVYESGVLYILMTSGVLGLLALSLLIISLVSRSSGSVKYIFLALLISNIFQDNVNSVFWFFLGMLYLDAQGDSYDTY